MGAFGRTMVATRMHGVRLGLLVGLGCAPRVATEPPRAPVPTAGAEARTQDGPQECVAGCLLARADAAARAGSDDVAAGLRGLAFDREPTVPRLAGWIDARRGDELGVMRWGEAYYGSADTRHG